MKPRHYFWPCCCLPAWPSRWPAPLEADVQLTYPLTVKNREHLHRRKTDEYDLAGHVSAALVDHVVLEDVDFSTADSLVDIHFSAKRKIG